MRALGRIIVMVVGCALTAGCGANGANDLVVYTALDSQFSEPVFVEFNKATGIRVRPKFDTEATKTVGLVEAIIAEKGRPRCDVFWNNEILNTLRLEKQGLLVAYRSPAAESYPAMFQSREGTWHGFAARARVLIVNTKLVPKDKQPGSIRDLLAPEWSGKAGIAKPLFGTTATHAACLFANWGSDEAKDFFKRVKENQIKILSGNKQVAVAVAAGQLHFGLTDTDDAIGELEKGSPVAIVYPDQGPEGLGTLFIPNSLAIIAGGPDPDASKRLVDYLLSPEVEALLAAGPSAQIPLNPAVKADTSRVATPQSVKAMAVDFPAAAEKWEEAAAFLRQQFAN